MKSSATRAAAFGAIAVPLLAAAVDANAHAHLVRAIPTENSTGRAPTLVHLDFSERLEPRYSGAAIMTANGKAILATSRVGYKAVNVAPRAALAPGAYMVIWHVVSADGHKMKGQYTFTVR